MYTPIAAILGEEGGENGYDLRSKTLLAVTKTDGLYCRGCSSLDTTCDTISDTAVSVCSGDNTDNTRALNIDTTFSAGLREHDWSTLTTRILIPYHLIKESMLALCITLGL